MLIEDDEDEDVDDALDEDEVEEMVMSPFAKPDLLTCISEVGFLNILRLFHPKFQPNKGRVR